MQWKKVKINEIIKYLKELDKTSMYNCNITEVKMVTKIWTDKQEQYLDKRFGTLESQVKNNSDGINKIIDILARNGMK